MFSSLLNQIYFRDLQKMASSNWPTAWPSWMARR